MTNSKRYNNDCYCYYITYPRCEVINCEPGTRIVKPGVSSTIQCDNPQPYINGRYGRGSVLLACKSTPGFELRSYIEQKVLDHLRYTFGYERPKYKKEHFIIEDTISAERTFVYIVNKLYDHYCGKYDGVLYNIICYYDRFTHNICEFNMKMNTLKKMNNNRLEMQRERRRGSQNEKDVQERLRKEKEDADEQERLRKEKEDAEWDAEWEERKRVKRLQNEKDRKVWGHVYNLRKRDDW
jgi:hypothetical protein